MKELRASLRSRSERRRSGEDREATLRSRSERRRSGEDREATLRSRTERRRSGSEAAARLEESIWLCPIEDRCRIDSARQGMLEELSLGSYLLLVDFTARLFREGKAAVSREVAEIFGRASIRLSLGSKALVTN
jgi:hypothetical protein